MSLDTPRTDVGVVIARFQVPYLHDVHRQLLDYVQARHKRVLILLGCSRAKTTPNNPLSFSSRQRMLLESYPDLEVIRLDDQKSDELWSKDVDRIVENVLPPGYSVTLYGGRTSFIPYYSGRYPTQELESTDPTTGTQVRRSVGLVALHTEAFRQGVVWATHNQYLMTIGVVDIALVDKDRSRVLLARKPGEAEWRFPGGFCDPQAECYEDDAKRELAEETGLYGEDWHYVGSAHVDDWRYRGEPHQLRTTFFVATHTMGAPRPQDDVAELRWIGFDRLDQVQIVKEHQKLLPMLLKYLGG